MPRDYKRVLEAQRQAELDGSDPMEAIMDSGTRLMGRTCTWVTRPGS